MAKTKAEKAAKKELRKAEVAQQIGLNWFAGKMLAKLELRNKRVVEADKTTYPGLLPHKQQGPLLGQKKDHDVWWYYRRMLGETKELQGALKKHDLRRNAVTRDAVISEACDVANFAAAIAEKAIEDNR